MVKPIFLMFAVLHWTRAGGFLVSKIKVGLGGGAYWPEIKKVSWHHAVQAAWVSGSEIFCSLKQCSKVLLLPLPFCKLGATYNGFKNDCLILE